MREEKTDIFTQKYKYEFHVVYSQTNCPETCQVDRDFIFTITLSYELLGLQITIISGPI